MDDVRRRRAGPGAPDEDTRGGFQHGGWHLPHFDDLSMSWVLGNLTDAGGFLLGRRTYEGFARPLAERF